MSTFISTGGGRGISLKDAIMQGLASDGGLLMPRKIPELNESFYKSLPHLSLHEIAFKVSGELIGSDIPAEELKKIIEKALNFDIPLIQLSDQIYSLELFHGPSLSFKDIGARFMAELINFFRKECDKDLHILVATSGDTGSAIAYSFFNMPGVRVWVLYPKGQVSEIQEKQLTTLGGNIKALEIDGSFDDCQSLVKQAFNDRTLREKLTLTSANSINIARLIPQSFYYFHAYARVGQKYDKIVFSVPSGNFGNLTGGLLAKRMGLPIERFIAATNINDSVPKYLETGIFHPHPSRQTLSNAMDVGNPSNFARILALYANNHDQIAKDLWGARFTDFQTQTALMEVYKEFNYITDPHGAIGFLGLSKYQEDVDQHTQGIFLETAHPAKFLDVVEPLIKIKITIPDRLQEVLKKNKLAIPMPNNYPTFKEILLHT